ncbi:hypothetical protein EMMF5_004473 [Cystobasidiomycetes sp. EMM_F5]
MSSIAVAFTATLLASGTLALPTSGGLIGRATSGAPLAGVVAAGSSATCTAHPYETSYSGGEACGFAPGSLTNFLHVAAIDGSLDKGRCNSCISVTADGMGRAPVYVLIVDKKGGDTVGNTGLDLSATAYNEITGASVPPSGVGGAGVPMSWTQVPLENCAVKWSGQNCPSEFMGNYCN